MKRRTRYFCAWALVLVCTMAFPMASFASRGNHNDKYESFRPQTPTDRTTLNVRVNGYEVNFPDAQPFVDENGRTMIPLRFATEALGAEVEWDSKTRTASISKNGITAKVSIGSDIVTVVKDGGSSQVTMDTTAVLKDGRTYVPIRYVAEALGAYVDYSAIYKTVGIYQDVLTAEEIEKLHSYQRYGSVERTDDYEQKLAEGKEVDLERFCYHEEFQDSFASARELLYDSWYDSVDATYTRKFPTLGISVPRNDEELYMESLVKEAKAFLDFDSENYKVEFRTDTSSIYSPPDDDVFWNVRGYLVVTTTGEKTKEGRSHGSEIKELFKNAGRSDAADIFPNWDDTSREVYDIAYGKSGYTTIVPVDIQIADASYKNLTVFAACVLDDYVEIPLNP
ncbi:MAG: copper amine oxidase N-terminal domain-containing protein [Oscillospiraceae bacterium]|nr:copper amine oxidase N-terminal domain-containing protein [Oscillospiraceae bacterium]